MNAFLTKSIFGHL